MKPILFLMLGLLGTTAQAGFSGNERVACLGVSSNSRGEYHSYIGIVKDIQPDGKLRIKSNIECSGEGDVDPCISWGQELIADPDECAK
ncbi:MAG: hypothetical protein NDJ90_13540 [Oligoflexia bacterium]|nr:hypothetical protein [Oligoflexia bacterium]